MLTSVVTWDSDIDVFRWGVQVSQSDDWDVNVRSFLDGLSIGSWVGNNDQSWFLERTGDVVGERTWSESTSNWSSTSVSGELQNGSLTVGSRGDGDNIFWVWNGSNDSSSQNQLFPGLTDVNDVDTVWSSVEDVWFLVDLF